MKEEPKVKNNKKHVSKEIILEITLSLIDKNNDSFQSKAPI
jgi:hypothetical protein